MLEYSRNIVAPSFASKLAKAFGFTLKQLGFKGQKKYRLTNAPIDAPELECVGISIEELAGKIVATFDYDDPVFSDVRLSYGHTELENIKTGRIWREFNITSPYNGRGSSAEDIVNQCVRLIRRQYAIEV